MNCQDFETIMVEIARDRLMDAVARARGLAHAETCAHCAALLAEERALSVKLRALATAAAAEAIHARVETALLAAFQQRVTAPAQEPTGVPQRRRWWLAAAALVLLTCGLSLASWFNSSSKQESTLTGATPPVIAPAPRAVEQARPPLEGAPQTARLDSAPKAGRRQRRVLQTSANQSLVAERRELVTRFFPVHQGSELIPLESAQIIRVRMPRANLIALGIPVNQERADETIQADVLVSNDGLARAIRLVY